MDELDLLPVYCDPGRGLPLSEALIYYNSVRWHPWGSPGVLAFYRSLIRPTKALEPDLYPSNADYTEIAAYYRNALLEFILFALQDGDLTAKGYIAPGQMNRTVIPADWWTRPRFDLADNWAEAHGTRVLDVRVFPVVNLELPDAMVHEEPVEAASAPPSKHAMVEAWYRKRVAVWRPGTPVPTQEADRQAARRKFGPGHRDALDELRRLLAPAAWKTGKRGRKHSTA